MNLSPMRYKNYVWPHNPRVYGISFERKVAVYKVPFGRYTMQDMGMTYRVLRGEGEFVGARAYDEFQKLATVFYNGGPGILVHPVWQLTNAYFVSLTLAQEPREDYVSYTFEFWEDVGSMYSAGLKKVASASSKSGKSASSDTVYTVVSGDTLWAIAQRNGLTLQQLLGLNPQIKNPNLIYPGDRIVIRKGS